MANIITAGNSTNGGTAITTDTSGTLNIVTGSGSGSNAISVDTSQNVGIGTTTPAAKVDVVGASGVTSFTGTSFLGMQVRGAASTNDYSGIGFSTTGQGSPTAKIAAYFSGSGSYLQFGTSNSYGSGVTNTAMTIDFSGNLIIAKTTTAATTAGAYFSASDFGALAVSQATGNRAAIFSNTSGTGTGNITINASTTSYNTSSDYRLKEDIQPMTGALAKVSALKPVTYKWKADGSNGEGFIAHELQAIVPDCVTGEKDAVNEDGSIKPQGIDTSFLVATLTAAIQELKAELDAVKAKVGV